MLAFIPYIPPNPHIYIPNNSSNSSPATTGDIIIIFSTVILSFLIPCIIIYLIERRK